MKKRVTVIGGGLAGCEAAWQVAEQGLDVTLYEMRPNKTTGAHVTGLLAELVCSNSLGSGLPDRATGLLLEELRRLGSLLVACADKTRIPAGGAVAVDRAGFAELVTERISTHDHIQVVREEVTAIPSGPVIIASGPLTSDKLATALSECFGMDQLFFFDALAPIVERESIDMDIAFYASRYGRGESEQGDYINCPFNKIEYDQFIDALLGAETIELKSFEQQIVDGVRAGVHRYFEGCLPIEIMAQRGRQTLAYGPMRPVGLDDPRTGRRPYAALQLRQDNQAASLFNLVGFQTNLKYAEQKRVFSMIPGLQHAQFVRYGQMHRNTFIAAPEVLVPTLQTKGRDDLFLAGQLVGVEGYAGNIGTGLLAGRNLSRFLQNRPLLTMPHATMLGALCEYISKSDVAQFQPMKANFGLLPLPQTGKRLGKRERAQLRSETALSEIDHLLVSMGI